MVVTWGRALGWRLRRHFLAQERADSIETVVSRLVAVPAWSGDADTALGLRLTHQDEDDVAAAVAKGQMFATYAFRGATHYMTPSSASVHLALRCATRQWERPAWRRHYRLEPADWPRLRATVRDALSGGPLTQHELAHTVGKDPAYSHLRAAFEDKSHTFLKAFGWQGDLCFGPSGDGPTFRSLGSVPGWAGLTEIEEAGPLAIRAYLAAYGPATVDRIHYWLGQGLSAGRTRIDAWIDRMDDELTAIPVEGTSALCRAEDVDDITSSPESDHVVFLPGSDQWILGTGTSDATVVSARHRPYATRGANLILIGGRVGGTWKLERDAVRAQWFDGRDVTAAHSTADGLEQLAKALGRELRLSSH